MRNRSWLLGVIGIILSLSFQRRAVAAAPEIPPIWFAGILNFSTGSPGAALLNPEIGIDQANNLHITYYDSYDGLYGVLKYSLWNGSTWANQIIDTSGGANPALQIDHLSQPHIAYYEIGPSRAFHYAYKEMGIWHTETITSGVNQTGTGFGIALALSDIGQPSVAYTFPSARNYQYSLGIAHRSNGAWQFELFDQVAARTPKIKLDHQGYAHVSFWDPNTKRVVYVVQTSLGGWISSTVGLADDKGNFRVANDLALDTTDHPHVVYSDGGENRLMYASWNGSSWVTDTVDTSFPLEATLIIDSYDTPHVAYTDPATGAPRYAVRQSTGWLTQTLYPFTAKPEIGLDVTSNSTPYIVFTESSTGNSMLAFALTNHLFLPSLYR